MLSKARRSPKDSVALSGYITGQVTGPGGVPVAGASAYVSNPEDGFECEAVTDADGFYETAGCLRDVIQNHLFQVMCNLAMEPPVRTDSESVRDEKVKVLRALRPLEGRDAILNTYRAQYTSGSEDGHRVPGYKDENGRTISMPCIKPPWGKLLAVNANTGEIAWQTRLGVTDDLPEGKKETGRGNTTGGPIVTAGGLVFLGRNDGRVTALDASTGDRLWQFQTEAAVNSAVSTFMHNGQQMLVAQALKSFALWTGLNVPFEPIYERTFGKAQGGK